MSPEGRGAGIGGLFLATSPVDDTVWMLRLFPLWWVLGVEQLLAPLLFGWAAVKAVWMRRGHVVLPPGMLAYVTFLFAMGCSALLIVEGYRYITFLRTFGVYVGGALLYFSVVNTATEVEDSRRILDAVAFAMGAACLAAVLGIVGVRPEVHSAMGRLLPGWVRGTAYGGSIAVRTLGHMSWFSVIGRYFRASSLFVTPTLFSAALAVTLPVLLARWWIAPTRPSRWRAGGLVVTAFACLLMTTGRVSILSGTVGCGILVTWLAYRRNGSLVAVAAGALLALAGLGTLGLALTDAGASPVGAAQARIEAAALARGGGSYGARSYIYRKTWQGFLESPLFGWGTQRHLPNFPYPAGSHSHWFGHLYKYGIFGLLAFLTLATSVWRATRPPRPPPEGDDAPRVLIVAGQASLVAAALNMATDVLDLDAMVWTILWIQISAVVALRANLEVAEGARGSLSDP